MKKISGIFVILIALTTNLYAQEPSMDAPVVSDAVSVTDIEKLVTDYYLEALSRDLDLNIWIENGRSIASQSDLVNAIHFLHEYLTVKRSVIGTEVVGLGNTLFTHASADQNNHLQAKIEEVRIAYQLLSEENTRSILAKDHEKTIHGKASFKNTVLYKILEQQSLDLENHVDALLEELSRIENLYSTRMLKLPITVDSYFLSKAKNRFRLLMAYSIGRVAEEKGISVEQVRDLVLDLGNMRGGFSTLNNWMRLRFDYLSASGFNYYDLLRDQQRVVCNQMIQAYELSDIEPFSIKLEWRGPDETRMHRDLEALESGSKKALFEHFRQMFRSMKR